MKRPVFLTGLLITLLAVTVNAQKDAGIRSLLTKKGLIELPTTTTAIKQKLDLEPAYVDDDRFGKVYTWITANGLLLAATISHGDTVSSVYMISEKNEMLGILPYRLVLKQTTAGMVLKNRKLNVINSKMLYSAGDPAKKAGEIQVIKKGNYYLRLGFDENDKLSSILITTKEPDLD